MHLTFWFATRMPSAEKLDCPMGRTVRSASFHGWQREMSAFFPWLTQDSPRHAQMTSLRVAILPDWATGSVRLRHGNVLENERTPRSAVCYCNGISQEMRGFTSGRRKKRCDRSAT